jgi:hypothetical protein
MGFFDRALKRLVARPMKTSRHRGSCIKKQASRSAYPSIRCGADGGGFAHLRRFALKFTGPGSITQPTYLESGFVVRLAGRGVGSDGCTNRGCLARAVPVNVIPVANNGMQTEAGRARSRCNRV